jgi:hypothetical protein
MDTSKDLILAKKIRLLKQLDNMCSNVKFLNELIVQIGSKLGDELEGLGYYLSDNEEEGAPPPAPHSTQFPVDV